VQRYTVTIKPVTYGEIKPK